MRQTSAHRTCALWALTAATLATAATMAEARPGTCADHGTVVAQLAERYGESRQSIGLAANNAVIEVFASQETGTWTITATVPGGQTCLIASGEAFQMLAETLPANGHPA